MLLGEPSIRGLRYTGKLLNGVAFDIPLDGDSSLVASYFFAQYEPPALAPILERVLGPNTCFYDVGANVGIYSLWAAALLPHGEVHSFEPVPTTADLLEDAIALNEFNNISLVRKAVGSREEVLRLATVPGHSGLSGKSTPGDPADADREILAPAVTLDDYSADRRDPVLIKIDVEGMEMEVLEGMPSLIERQQPLIVLESPTVRAGVASMLDLRRWSLRTGYDIWNLTPDGLQALEETPTSNILLAKKDAHADLLARLKGARFRHNQTI